ncbi:MAG: hypothetical protein K2H86_03355 [Muribaculaceae bacterium]|nr:hypothetical protein [Muribaculaceae bacterium]
MGNVWTGNNRAPWHDYTSRQIYHITLKKHPDAPDFGTLAGDWRLPRGTFGRSYVKASPLGSAIKNCLKEIRKIHPALRILQYALMPDHIHILLSVEDKIDEILGRKIAAFKVMVNKYSGLERVFEKGFNDKLLTSNRRLDTLYQYLRDNPFRLAVRKDCPGYFTRINRLVISDKACQAYGNYQLLQNPFKDVVVVHRADTLEERRRNRERWLYMAANGGVLVSPFISPAEKDVRNESESTGAKIILITHERFAERYKPTAGYFEMCVSGRLLIITLNYPAGTPLTRDICLEMNALAQSISAK